MKARVHPALLWCNCVCLVPLCLVCLVVFCRVRLHHFKQDFATCHESRAIIHSHRTSIRQRTVAWHQEGAANNNGVMLTWTRSRISDVRFLPPVQSMSYGNKVSLSNRVYAFIHHCWQVSIESCWLLFQKGCVWRLTHFAWQKQKKKGCWFDSSWRHTEKHVAVAVVTPHSWTNRVLV